MSENNKGNKNYIIIFFLLYIIISWNNHAKKKLKKNEIKYEENIYTNEINYKGVKISKSKLINDYLSKIDCSISEKNEEKKRFNQFYNLAEYSANPIIKSKLKDKFLEEISKLKNQKISNLDIFFISHPTNFGNNLVIVNNIIFYCIIIGCHKIILNKYHLYRKWLITKQIYNRELNITIMKGSNINCNDSNILCFYEISWIAFYPKVIIPQVKIDLIKEEILGNLPSVKIETDSLFIHIRGGDIFKKHVGRYYSQPPLCFYERIINSETFNKIYIFSIDRSNVIINALLNKYKYIIYNENILEYDISLLCHENNIVLSVSSFALSAIKLNDNLQNIWEFDIMRPSEKFLFLHHHIFKFNIKYTIHTMRPSDLYASKMFIWKRSPEQIKLMMEDKCPYDFSVTKPNP